MLFRSVLMLQRRRGFTPWNDRAIDSLPERGVLFAGPTIALERDELNEGAAKIYDPPVHDQEAKQGEHQNYGDHCEPVFYSRPAPFPGSGVRILVDVTVSASYVRPAIAVLLSVGIVRHTHPLHQDEARTNLPLARAPGNFPASGAVLRQHRAIDFGTQAQS